MGFCTWKEEIGNMWKNLEFDHSMKKALDAVVCVNDTALFLAANFDIIGILELMSAASFSG